MKKLTALCMCLLMVMSLVACANKENTKTVASEEVATDLITETQNLVTADQVSQLSSTTGINATSTVTLPTFIKNVTTNLGAGWNLGNSLDAYSSSGANETIWGNPTVTKAFVQKVYNAGFKTIRIPVSYIGKVGAAPNYTIDAKWLARIKTVVDYAYSLGMYVIIDIHHDGNNDTNNGAWLNIKASSQTAIQAKFKAIWKQVATKFSGYGSRLIFESMNEIMETGNYGAPTATTYKNINALNQIFVNTVRATGGKNASRYLLIPGYNTNITQTASNSNFKLPTDTVKNRLIVSVHFYDPWTFAGEGSTKGWGKYRTDTNLTIDSYGQEDYVTSQFKLLYTKFTSKGIPVIMGEMGAVYQSEAQENNRAYYISYVQKTAKTYGITTVVWDNGSKGSGKESFGIFNRSTGAVLHTKYLKALLGK